MARFTVTYGDVEAEFSVARSGSVALLATNRIVDDKTIDRLYDLARDQAEFIVDSEYANNVRNRR